ncbi:MAG: NAD(P)/FAD-dependent oxidoreductase [Actinobacteria bacterium]|nr:NAD(P)/FAD-dependent oxidoreductase [Actinomycetota bacterium]
MSYDAIIIGAGLGGCAAGCALAGAGKKVLILERMNVVGGRCSTQEREGFKLDMGSHMVIGSDHGSFEDALSRVGKQGSVKWHYFNKLFIGHEDVKIDFNGSNIVISGMDKEDIEVYAASGMQEMMKLMPGELMNMGLGMMGQMMPMVSAMVAPIAEQFDNVSIKDFMDQYMKWTMASDIMMLLQFAMYGTPSWMTATSELIRTVLGAMEYYKPGMNPAELIGYPMGGLISIPQKMCEGIQEKGGEVRTSSNVKRVVVEGGNAVGVELDSGEIINAPIVISNAGIKETVAELVGDDQFDQSYSQAVAGLIPGVSAFCVRGAMQKPITDLEWGFAIPDGDLVPYYQKLWDGHEIPDARPPIMFSVPSNMDPSLAPEGKQLIIAIGALMYESKDDYSKMEPLALDSVEYVIPGFKENLMWYDFLDPSTYIALGEQLAPAVGLAQCVGQVGASRPSSKSPVEGLYYVGGEAGKNISGIATDMCTKSGLACADYIIQNT